MSNIKGKGQRLIPEELLKYLEALKNKYPDAIDLVEANPTLEGGEDSLSSVLINGIKYAVGGGSEVHLYQHNLFVNLTNGGILRVSIIKSDNTPFTLETFNSYLVGTDFYPTEGWIPAAKRNIQEFRILNNNYIEYRYIEVVDGVLNEDYASTQQYTLGTDTITQIF